jgi:photosystem II stability/assembly factor-like uncharacterized protein
MSVVLVACSPSPTAPSPPAPSAISVAPLPPEPTTVVVPEEAGPPPAPAFEVTIDAAPSGAFAGASGNVPGESGITGVAAKGDRVIAVGNGFALRSNDRGLHFARVDVPLRFPVVWFATSDEIYAAGETDVFRSTDGGATFEKRGKPSGAVTGIWGKSASEIYVVGGGGTPFVARSTDQGATFTTLTTPVKSGWFYDVTTSNGNDLIVVGTDDNAVILRSTDAGKTWTRIPVFKKDGQHEESRKVCFTSGVLFASSAYALHMTRDFGKTWKVATQVGGEVLGLACRGSEVIVGGRGRRLFASHDLGATWKPDPLGPLFTDIALVSAQAIAIAETGEAYVGFEGLYDKKRGSLFCRSP